MNNLVLTEVGLAVRFFRSGVLKYFDSKDLVFYITDLCYEIKPVEANNDKVFAQKMIEQGLLKVVSFDEHQMKRVNELHKFYKPKFIFETVSGLILAQDTNYKLISENDLLIEIASEELSIRAFNKEWFLLDIISEVSVMGVSLDIEVLRAII